MKKIFNVKMLENECWYGGVVVDFVKMPYDKNTKHEFDLAENNVFDQAASILLSNKGRAIRYEPDNVKIEDGVIGVTYETKEPQLISAGSTLKDAYRYAVSEWFNKDDTIPPEDCFICPQFNDWMEVGYNQTQEGILKYAEEIVKTGYKHSVLMIDDKWSDDYGDFEFSKSRFPDPEGMVKKLHDSGFKVMLWETPFVSPDSPEFRELRDKDYLLKDENGNPAIRKWWNGYSAVLDLSNPNAFEWLKDKNSALIAKGIDGFKFDAGDVDYYKATDKNFGNVSPVEQNRKYCEFGKMYKYNEFRSMVNESGTGCMWRQCDKTHSFDEGGLKGIVGGALMQNLLGYWYSAPDMVGGGSIGSDKLVDEELFVRYAEAASLMAMMQMSRLPHGCLSRESADLCKKYADLHYELGEYIYSHAVNAATFGDPILKMMEYEYPNQGFEREFGTFMLGDKYLVSPVVEKGQFSKKIKLPQGKWEYVYDGKTYEGGKEYEFKTPVEILPYFIKK